MFLFTKFTKQKNIKLQPGNGQDIKCFTALTEFTDDFIYIVDKNLTHIYINKKYQNRIGLKDGDLAGKKITEFHTPARAKELNLKITKVFSTGKSLMYEHKSKRDGKYFLSTINPVKEAGDTEPVAVIVIAKDITDQKKAEEKLKTSNEDLKIFKLAVENASDYIIITDKDGFILYANRATKQITGYTATECLGEKADKNFWGSDEGPEFHTKLWEIIKDNKKVFAGEIKNIKKKGTKYTSWASIAPVLDEKGRIQYYISVERDITDLIAIDKAKTELISLASHQLRTPLTSISWFVEMILDGDIGKLNDMQRDYLQEVLRASGRMTDLVNGLLNISRIELGTFMVEPILMCVKDETESLLKELRPPLIEKKIKVNKLFEKDLPKIKADPKLLRIILQNLLTNAIKYSLPGGAIEIELKKQSKNIVIRIADAGYGIPLDQQKKIFTKLFRADNVMQKVPNGNGLGLYIIKSILDEAGGKIWFKSIENKGTTFFVSIPLSGMKKREGKKELDIYGSDITH